jgi:hypothetical protein
MKYRLTIEVSPWTTHGRDELEKIISAVRRAINGYNEDEYSPFFDCGYTEVLEVSQVREGSRTRKIVPGGGERE